MAGHDTKTRAREAFILELGRSLHIAGAPANRLEEALEYVCDHFGLVGQFFSTPTSLWAGFGTPQDQRVVLARVPPGEVNLGRLVDLDELAGRVGRGEIGVNAGLRELQKINNAPPTYPLWLMVVCFALASATAGVFFGGSMSDTLASLLVGGLVGVCAMVAGRFREIARLMDFLGGLVAGGVAVAFAHRDPTIDSYIVTISGLIVLVPGLTLTLAVNELATRHLVSGSARVMHALTVFVSIGFGVALGWQLTKLLSPAEGAHTPLPDWCIWPALSIAPLAFTVLFQVKPRHAGLVVAGGALAFLGSRAGGQVLSPELGASVGAFALGLLSNVQARRIRRPALIVTVPGVILLVPGSIGFRSFSELLEQDATGGVTAAFSMIMVAVAISAGLLMAQLTFPSRQPL
ncbi:MAG: threonine/serine exporter family protein [Planctomycetota bacterium]